MAGLPPWEGEDPVREVHVVKEHVILLLTCIIIDVACIIIAIA